MWAIGRMSSAATIPGIAQRGGFGIIVNPQNIIFINNSTNNLKKKKHRQRTLCSSSSAPFHNSPLINSMNLKIKEQLNAQSVTIADAYGDGRHVSISVVSEAFEGKSPVNRQRMVYKAIWEELQTTVHAVDHMSTKTPIEAQAAAADSQ